MYYARIARTLIVATPLLGVLIFRPALPTVSLPFGAKGMTMPTHVVAGIPFVLRDQYSTQVCVSSRSGQPLPPFLVPGK